MPSLLLPSGKVAQKAATYIPHLHCKQCYTANGALNYLEATDDSLVACHTCGFVDERSTWAHSAVSIPDTPRSRAIVPGDSGVYTGLRSDPGVSFGEIWGTFETTLEKQFKDEVDALFRIYLEDPETCLFDTPVPTLVQPAKIWFLRIRERERAQRLKRYQANPTGRQTAATLAAHPGRRKSKYQVVVAIRFAAQDSNLVHANARLDRDDKDGVHELIARADDRPFAFPLDQLWLRTQRASVGSSGALDSLNYLYTVNRKCCALVGRALSPIDGFLCYLLQTVRRLQTLYEYSLTGRYDEFITRPTSGGRKPTSRQWDSSDFLWFREHNFNWQQVLQVSYDLYRAQQCVSLWNKRPSIQSAACLALYGCIAIAGQVMPHSTLILTELCAYFNVEPTAAFTRSGELRKMLCAWSTSFEDAGLVRPQILCPVLGGIGNGLSGWQSDKRRPIPELEIAALSAQVVHKHWQAIARSRSRSTPMQSYPAELNKARMLAAKAGPRYRPGTEPKSTKKKTAFGADYSKYALNQASTVSPDIPAPPRPLPAPASSAVQRASSTLTSTTSAITVQQPSLSPFHTTSNTQYPMTPMQEISQSLPEHSLDHIQDPRLDAQDAPHVGILIQERQHYIAYDDALERRRGNLVPEDVERAMNKWLSALREDRSIPEWKDIDKEYLLGLGIRDDETELRRPGGVDLGPWIQRVKDRMSPTEALLRAGVRPLEFPLHYIVRSIEELRSQLDLSGIHRLPSPIPRRAALVNDAGLAPIGEAIDEAQLDAELSLLFSEDLTSERLGQIFCSEEEVARRREVYDALDAEERQSRGSPEKARGRVFLGVEEAERLALLLANSVEDEDEREIGGGERREQDERDVTEDDEQVRMAVFNAGLGLELGPPAGGLPLTRLGLGEEEEEEGEDGEEESVDDEDEQMNGDPPTSSGAVPSAKARAPRKPRPRAPAAQKSKVNPQEQVTPDLTESGDSGSRKRPATDESQEPRKRGRPPKVKPVQAVEPA